MLIQIIVDGECLITLGPLRESALEDLPHFLETMAAPAFRQIALYKGAISPRTRESVMAEIAGLQK